MFERRLSFKLCFALGLLCFSSTATAQVKPRFVIAFDTSGSMAWDLSGQVTFGDGVGRLPTGGEDPALVLNGVFYGCGTTAGLDRDCDGLPNDSRMAIAKQAVRNMIGGFGDVEWALARFPQSQAADAVCWVYNGENSCTHQSYGNPQCNTGANNDGCTDDIPDACDPEITGNRLQEHEPGDFDGCINYQGSCGSSGADGGQVLVGFPGLSAFSGMDNRPAILRWMDNVETAFNTTTTSGNYCNHASSGDCELRPNGSTPLGGILGAALDYVVPVRTADADAGCRGYSVILITDGAETCGGDPNGEAASLLAQNVRTYVVGVSITSTDQASLNDIASNGGTTSAYFANSPAELAAALSQIVSDSLVFESCNGLDDDCDGAIDEDLPQGQPGSAAQPEALFCDGEGQRTSAQNDQVNQRLDPDVAQSSAITDPIVCGWVRDDCTSAGTDDDCDGANDEDAPDLTACGTCPGAVDVCNGIDDDCDGTYDEGSGGGAFSACPIECTEDVPCGSDVGECQPGVYRCIDGVLDSTCFGETVGSGEVCDELDNDCDGIVDDPATLARTCTTAYGDTGICQPGTQFCAKTSIGEIADGTGYRIDGQGDPVCVSQVLPEDRELCDALDHDCDGNPFTCTSATCSIGPDPAFVGNTCGLGVGVCTGTLECDENGDPDGGAPELVCNAPSPSGELCNNIDDDCDGTVDEESVAGNDLGGNPGGASGDVCGTVATDEGVCNRGQYQCVNGFWQCSGQVGPATEICDGLDNDCDGLVDAADSGINDPRIGQQCGTTIGECEPGTSVCSGGQIVCTPVQGPVDEDCDGLDNDCDNLIDEQLPDTLPPLGERDVVLCGDDTGLCEQGELACVEVPTTEDADGFDYRCVGGVGPVAELCDGDDNDCDAETDECTGNPASQAFMDCESDSIGTMGPAPFDRGLGAGGGEECGADNTACARGKLKCVYDVDSTNADPDEPGLVCVGADFGVPELCDGLDNDCDLKFDEQLDPANDPRLGQSCGDVGAARCDVPPQEDPNDAADDTLPCGQCRFGVQDCVGGMIECIGSVGPDQYESCNLTDDDCDGQIDECVDPADTSPECSGEVDPETPVGQPCGSGAACSSGVNACVDGVLECQGVDQGETETCNNIDDDCDGAIDEGFQKGLACGQSEGECHPGVWACDSNGGRTCVGAVTPIDEVCDNLDNDCDTRVDEGLGLGDECGTDEGVCATGELACVNGQTVCSGEIGPQPETCDCEDNDCDGSIDEDTTGNPVCPTGSACLMCQCALPCAGGLEFGAQCPQGKAPIQTDDECYCVGQQCNAIDCQRQTIETGGEVQCAPDDNDVGTCLCRNNECTFRCAGVTCGDALICDPTDGRCKQRSCLLPQFRCSGEQRCTISDGVWQCVDDACADKECASGEACRDGVCLSSCAKVECSTGNRCQDGNCVRDNCHGVNCDPGLVCDPANGDCVVAGACVAGGCPDGEICDAVSGECAEDPCLRTRCPYGEECNSETSECTLRCFGGLLYCGEDECINPMTSRAHCGASGDCQGENAGQGCEAGLVCSRGQCSETCADNLVNCDGECIDPQHDVRHCGASSSCEGDQAGEQCRTGFTCTAGRCTSITGEGGTGGPGGPDEADDASRVIVSGGGGCTCSTVGAAQAPSATSHRGALSLLLVLFALCWLARRRAASHVSVRKAGAAALIAMLAVSSGVLGSGCKVDTFCLDCPSEDDQPIRQDGGGGGAGGSGTGDGSVGPADSGTPDAAPPPSDGGADAAPRPDGGCLDRELCNGLDDDCDNTIDEGADPAELNIDIDTNAQHCGGCGQACGLAHAFNTCVSGECQIDATQGVDGCDIGYVNHDGDDTNGCEYRCSKTADDDAVCDLIDNDCDREIDEDVDLDNDPLNCGSCNDQCRLRRVEDGGECVTGLCVIGTKDCEDGFANLDTESPNGCEHQCFAFPPTPEQCNGLDDDCDSLIDEGVDTTDSEVGQACGEDEGECVAGVIACEGGVEVCSGSIGASTEVCDGLDNDCDGTVDTDHPELGLPCGEATPGSQCSKGTLQIPVSGCSGGVVQELECRGGQGPVAEICDGLDNDCDGRSDEETDGVRPQAGQLCVNTSTGVDIVTDDPPGECQAGTTECVSGNLLCRNEVAPAPHDLCDGLDRDCDGQAFTGYTFSGNIATAGPDPRMGDSCGSDTGECAFGELRCHLDTQSLVCDNQVLPTTEACDGRDDDCDGRIDERPTSGFLPGENIACVTNPDGTVDDTPPASASEGECQTGLTVCSAGRIGCQGQIGPQSELCDALDQDCDGEPINGVAVTDPDVGDPCGPPTVGVCQSGTTACVDGSPPTIVCQGALPNASYVPPAQNGTAESACDGQDNDCDGATDEGDPAAYDGASCCDLLGFDCCDMGTRQCSAGRVTCVYPTDARFPQNESCGDGPGGIGADDDCDGTSDEGFDLLTDVNNCGSCGNACAPTVADPHAVIVCASGECEVGACVGDFVDADYDADPNTETDWQNGCETACSFTGNEICDGEDNDCNGTTDDLDSVPSVVCIPSQRGVCNVPELLALGPACSSGMLECDIQAVVDAGYIANYEATETTCDGLDNDCDGVTDEGYNVGVPCNNGELGECREEGVIACTGPNSSACNAPSGGTATAEVCDGLDNDCDGTVDDFGAPGPSNLVGNFEIVDLGAATSNTLVMAYEASRPDATATLAGRITTKPCSVEGVQPWTNVTWTEASSACCALNANGQCTGDGQGWRLCDASTFEYVCQAPSQGCTWGYSDSGSAVCDHAFNVTTYENVCHGAESTHDGVVTCADPDDVECATVAGSTAFPECYANWSGGPVSDLSGNVQEWTNTSLGSDLYSIRGGSYNDVELGRACGFDFEVGTTSFRFPTTGFRCCWYPASGAP